MPDEASCGIHYSKDSSGSRENLLADEEGAHSYASQLATAGVTIPEIQALLGHADIQTTMRYAHLCPKTTATRVDVLDEGGSAKWAQIGHKRGGHK